MLKIVMKRGIWIGLRTKTKLSIGVMDSLIIGHQIGTRSNATKPTSWTNAKGIITSGTKVLTGLLLTIFVNGAQMMGPNNVVVIINRPLICCGSLGWYLERIRMRKNVSVRCSCSCCFDVCLRSFVRSLLPRERELMEGRIWISHRHCRGCCRLSRSHFACLVCLQTFIG
jgi:hypothetical protein